MKSRLSPVGLKQAYRVFIPVGDRAICLESAGFYFSLQNKNLMLTMFGTNKKMMIDLVE